MKKAFKILKDRAEISIMLTRDSVCAADDYDAPHQKIIRLYSFINPIELAKESSSGYLPSVAGTGHVWVCKLNDKEIAKITYNKIEGSVKAIEYKKSNRIHFMYKSARY